jgi:carboxypeptidase C (cathepsin A)
MSSSDTERDKLTLANKEGKSQSISANGEKRSMRTLILRIVALTTAILALPIIPVHAQAKDETSTVKVEATKTDTTKPEQFKAEQQASKGSVTIGGNAVNYDAYAGTLVVHPKGWDDVPQNADPDPKNKGPEASMFYVAYFKSDNKGAPPPSYVSL